MTARLIVPAPRRLARATIAGLKAMADPVRAAHSLRYFKSSDEVSFLGLTTPQVRDVEGGVWAKVAKAWTLTEAIVFGEAMLTEPSHEARAIGLLVVLRFKRAFDRTMFDRVKSWLAADRLNNWALVDVFCPDALGPLLAADPVLIERIKGWTAHPNRWVKRASAVSFIKLARRGAHLEPIYDIAVRLFPVDDDLIHKATGWLLREAGKADASRLEAFLLDRGSAIPRTALRYAIERFPAADRKRLLAATRRS